jgi:hypothetical protein
MPENLEWQYTLATAVARFEELRYRAALADASAPLSREDALELLSLGELIARKAGYGRQLDVRAARAAGASWSQIGEAMGTSKQSAWEAHTRWIDGQAAAQQRRGEPDPDWVTGARDLAGPPGAS